MCLPSASAATDKNLFANFLSLHAGEEFSKPGISHTPILTFPHYGGRDSLNRQSLESITLLAHYMLTSHLDAPRRCTGGLEPFCRPAEWRLKHCVATSD